MGHQLPRATAKLRSSPNTWGPHTARTCLPRKSRASGLGWAVQVWVGLAPMLGSACCEAPEGAHQTQDWTRLCSVSLHLPCRLTRAKAKTWAETLRCLSKPWQKPHLLPSRWPKQVTRGGECTVCLHSERGRVVTQQGWEFGKGYSLATTGGLGPNNRVLGRAFCGWGGTFPGEAEAAPTPGCSSGVVHCSAVPCAFGLLVGRGALHRDPLIWRVLEQLLSRISQPLTPQLPKILYQVPPLPSVGPRRSPLRAARSSEALAV